MAGSGSASSAWVPLRIGVFRTLWIAALFSNMGDWMQTVGAQWLLVHGSHAAVLVSLVQTADALPAVLFALVGGVLADIFDRVKLLVAILAGMTAAGGALTALTAAHRIPPALLLMFTFALGTGASWPNPPSSRWCPTWFPAHRCPPPQLSARSTRPSPLARPGSSGLTCSPPCSQPRWPQPHDGPSTQPASFLTHRLCGPAARPHGQAQPGPRSSQHGSDAGR